MKWQRLQTWWQDTRKHSWWSSPTITQPLLSDADLQQLHQAACAPSAVQLQVDRDLIHPLLGERTSVFSGSGYEFADNRPYATGDDTRFINWRLFARTGQYYRKLFLEERRPQVWLVVDRGESMRFGTRVRLKVTQAVMLAVYYLYRAQLQQLAIGGVVLEPQAQWYKPVRSTVAVQPLLQQLISPCPPFSVASAANELIPALRQLQVQLAAGCIILLISDFRDLAEAHLPILCALAQKHTVLAYHILDPIEITLPIHGQYPIADSRNATTHYLQCENNQYRLQYAETMQQQHTQTQRWLTQAGIRYQRILANQNFIPHGPDS